MALPENKISLVEALWIKQMHFHKAGDIQPGHTHTHNHTTIISKGSFLVTVNGKETTVVAPNLLFINKDLEHELKALEDDSVAYCVHACREFDTGDIVDPSTLPEGSTLEPFLGSK